MQIPTSLLWAIFAYMAIESLPGCQFWERLLLLITDPQCRVRLLQPSHATYLPVGSGVSAIVPGLWYGSVPALPSFSLPNCALVSSAWLAYSLWGAMLTSQIFCCCDLQAVPFAVIAKFTLLQLVLLMGIWALVTWAGVGDGVGSKLSHG